MLLLVAYVQIMNFCVVNIYFIRLIQSILWFEGLPIREWLGIIVIRYHKKRKIEVWVINVLKAFWINSINICSLFLCLSLSVSLSLSLFVCLSLSPLFLLSLCLSVSLSLCCVMGVCVC